MKEREELELILKLIGKYNLPLSPILEYAVKEKMEDYPAEGQTSVIVNDNQDEDNAILDDVYNTNILPKSDIKWFCLSTLTCLEGLMENRTYQILKDTLNGEPRRTIALKHGLTQERIRQIVVKATKQAKELLMEQRRNLEKEKADNARQNVQHNLMREEIIRLKALLPKELLLQQKDEDEKLDEELVKLLETPIEEINLPARAVNILQFMDVKKFVDIPQIESYMKLLSTRNSGKKTVHDISSILEDFHLTYGMSYTEIVDALITNDWHTAKKKWMGGYKKKVEIKKHDDFVKRESTVVPHVGTVKEDRNEIENVKQEETIVLTEEIIEAARTPNGGFTKSQLAAIGIAWPPPQDWIKEKVGTIITPTQLEAFNHIEYATKASPELYQRAGSNTYKDVSSSSDDRRKMEAILQAMTHFISPATPHDIARTISRTAWGGDVVREETVDSYLKRLPEVEYIKWGKYMLKSKTNQGTQSTTVQTDIKTEAKTSYDRRIGYVVRLFPSQLKGEIVRVRKDSKGTKKLVVKTTKGDLVEVVDLPYLYEILKRN